MTLSGTAQVVQVPALADFGVSGAEVHDHILYLSAWCGGLAAIHLTKLTCIWSCFRKHPRFSNPRQLRAMQGSLWLSSDAACVAQLREFRGGVEVRAHSATDGRVLWNRRIPLPAPAPWTESVPAREGLPTEELAAFFAMDRAVMVVVIARSTRRVCSPPKIPLPPFRSKLEFYRIDHNSGEFLWHKSYDGGRVNFLEREAFNGLFLTETDVCELDLHSGAMVQIMDVLPLRSWPRRVDGRVLVAIKVRGGISLRSVGRNDSLRAFISRSRVKSLEIFDCDGTAVLQVNDKQLLALSDNLKPKWEFQSNRFIYRVAAVPCGPIFAATPGKRGFLYALRRQDGARLLEAEVAGGAAYPVHVPGTRLVVAVTQGGLVAGDAVTKRHAHIPLASAERIVGVAHRTVAAVGLFAMNHVTIVRF